MGVKIQKTDETMTTLERQFALRNRTASNGCKDSKNR